MLCWLHKDVGKIFIQWILLQKIIQSWLVHSISGSTLNRRGGSGTSFLLYRLKELLDRTGASSNTWASDVDSVVSEANNIPTLCITYQHFGTDLSASISMVTSTSVTWLLTHDFSKCLGNPVEHGIEFDLPLTMSSNNCCR